MRPQPRFPIEYDIALRRLWKNQIHPGLPTTVQPDKEIVTAKSRNLSLGGLGIELNSAPSSLKPGEEYSVRITFGDPNDRRNTLTFTAELIWQRSTSAGLRIKEVSQDSLHIYRNLVEGYASLLALDPVGHRNFS